MISRVFLATCLLVLSYASSAFGNPQAFFSSSAIMELDWVANNVSSLNLQEINEFESAIVVLLHTTMKKESESDVGLLPEQQVLAVDLHVKNVTRQESNFHMNAVVDVLYVAKAGVPDMASILIRLSRKENVADMLLDDIYDILGGSAESVVINFKTAEPPAQKLWQVEDDGISKEKADKTLILACTLLCASLVLVISVLVYVAGGWRDLREKLDEQIDWFKNQRNTYSADEDDDEESGGVDVADSQSYEGDEDDEDEDDDDNATAPSGIIGASSKEENAAEGLGINRTPERGITDDGYDTTPFSEMSAYTDTSRAPLGITSMRKMRNPNDKMMSLPPLAYQ
ncbi:expressed unknown protein [Seminavis robusta]|uniref:Uncharacterized protein n=1 Tax=Seminavis robusta TaxID=568900 RepID=A0A9N8H5Q5_9STRA|nr:expressed unknown protein [Seminavis robusta]|eukprot:Sro149_g068520.1 n/a (342) ;mRNA; r:64556-65683